MNHSDRMALKRRRIIAAGPIVDPDDAPPTEYQAAAPAILALILAHPGKSTAEIQALATFKPSVTLLAVAWLECEHMAYWPRDLRGWKAAEK